MKNFFKKPPVTPEPKEDQENPSKILKTAEFSFFNQKDFPKLLPYILFLTVLAIVYISNAHYSEKTIRKSDRITKELKELRAEYITIKSDLMYRSKQSQVAQRLQATGLKELRNPPKKITPNSKDEH